MQSNNHTSDSIFITKKLIMAVKASRMKYEQSKKEKAEKERLMLKVNRF